MVTHSTSLTPPAFLNEINEQIHSLLVDSFNYTGIQKNILAIQSTVHNLSLEVFHTPLDRYELQARLAFIQREISLLNTLLLQTKINSIESELQPFLPTHHNFDSLNDALACNIQSDIIQMKHLVEQNAYNYEDIKKHLAISEQKIHSLNFEQKIHPPKVQSSNFAWVSILWTNLKSWSSKS